MPAAVPVNGIDSIDGRGHVVFGEELSALADTCHEQVSELALQPVFDALSDHCRLQLVASQGGLPVFERLDHSRAESIGIPSQIMCVGQE